MLRRRRSSEHDETDGDNMRCDMLMKMHRTGRSRLTPSTKVCDWYEEVAVHGEQELALLTMVVPKDHHWYGIS